jgi:hypothetical protein
MRRAFSSRHPQHNSTQSRAEQWPRSGCDIAMPTALCKYSAFGGAEDLAEIGRGAGNLNASYVKPVLPKDVIANTIAVKAGPEFPPATRRSDTAPRGCDRRQCLRTPLVSTASPSLPEPTVSPVSSSATS